MPETVPIEVVILIQIAILICGLVVRGQSDRIRSMHHAGTRPLFSRGQTYLALGILVAAAGLIPLARAVPVWAAGNMLLLFMAGFLLVRGAIGVASRNEQKIGARKHRTAAFLRLVGTLMLFTPVLLMPWFIALLLCLPLIVGFIFNLAARRRMDQGAVLWTMALSLRSGSNMIEDLETLANSQSVLQRGKVIRLADRLFEGCTPDDALRRTPGVVTNAAVLAARAGAKNGTLAESLRDAAVRHTGQYEQFSGTAFSPSMAFLYLVAVPLVASLILSGIMVYIIPKFKEIFEGFDTNLPELTVNLINLSDWTARYWYLLAPFFLLGMALTCLLSITYVIGFSEFEIPLFGRWCQRLDLPNLLRIFASTVRQKRPLDETVNAISASHKRAAVRTSMDEVYSLMAAGEDPWQAMRSQKLLTQHELGALRSAQRAGNLPWALEQLAESLERRLSFRWKAWLELLQPLIVVVLGLTVGFICISMFLPLVKLLNDLS